MYLQLLLILAGVAAVTYGANWMVDGASSIAKRLRISDMVIGLTIVSFGTSAPELIVSVMATMSGNTDVAIGNVIGSNTLNIWLILGVAAMLMPMTIHNDTVKKEIPFGLFTILLAFVLINDPWWDATATPQLSLIDGLILLAFFVAYMYYMFQQTRKNPAAAFEASPSDRSVPFAIALVVMGIAGLTLGGKLIVDNAILIARTFGVSEAIISLTLVSIGTSIPELATSAVAAYKKNADIAVGNVIGSNIFNTLLILGISSTIAPLPMGGLTQFDFLVCIFAAVTLLGACYIGKRQEIYRWEAGFFLLCYVAYTVYLLNQA